MRKAFFLFGFMVASILATAQMADVTSAYNANKNGEYEKAVEYIEKAMTSEKATSKEKTWRYRGSIYLNVARDADLFVKYPTCLELARESYAKAYGMPKSYTDENTQGLKNVQSLSMRKGQELYEGGEYDWAASTFVTARKVTEGEPFNMVDSVATFFSAICYEKAEKYDQAIAGYQECAEWGYEGAKVYQYIVNLQKLQGKDEEAMATLKEGREKYPNDQGLIIEELNIYLIDGDFEKAEANLQKAAEQDPDNEILFFSLGSVYDNLGKFEQAETAYMRALELKPDYFDANYNLGALYFNKAVAMVNDANSIPPNEYKKYEAAIAEANAVFEKALPYLEKAHEVNPEDMGTLQSLKSIYIRMNMEEKRIEIQEKIDAQNG